MALTKYNFNSFDVTPVASNAFAFNSTPNGLTTAASGAMNLITTNTITSGVSSSSFTSNIDSTYDTYLFKFINIHPATDNTHLQMNFSTDSGSNYNVAKTSTHFYAQHNESGADSTLSYNTSGDLAQGTGVQFICRSMGNGNDECASGIFHLFNPSSSTFVKHFMCRFAKQTANDKAQENYVAGYGNTTSSIDAIQFSMSSGNIDAGDICLYGIA